MRYPEMFKTMNEISDEDFTMGLAKAVGFSRNHPGVTRRGIRVVVNHPQRGLIYLFMLKITYRPKNSARPMTNMVYFETYEEMGRILDYYKENSVGGNVSVEICEYSSPAPNLVNSYAAGHRW